jgi:preprotein translocase subunit SecG
MEIILQILTIIACVLLILVVLIQDSKGGGLSSSFGGSNQILGVRRTTDFLEKATWVLAIALLVFSLASSYVGTSASAAQSSTKDKAADMSLPGKK